MVRRTTRAVNCSQDIGELGTECSTEETPPADTSVTTQLYGSFDPLNRYTAVHHAQDKQITEIARSRFNGGGGKAANAATFVWAYNMANVSSRVVLQPVLAPSTTRHHLL